MSLRVGRAVIFVIWGAAVGAALISVSALLTACDCFFDVSGHLFECGTTTPIAGATITLKVDKGFNTGLVVPNAGTTDAQGRFRVGENESCGSTVTLTFEKDGFMPLERQFPGAPKNDVELCMMPAAAP